MKVAYSLFCIFWLSLFGAKAQQLQGVFVLDSIEGRNRMGGQIFAFAGSRFTHAVTGCISSNVDTGYFTYHNDTLMLRYDTWQQAASTFISTPLTRPSSSISLKLLDAETKMSVQDLVAVGVKSRTHPIIKHRTDSTATIIIDQTLPSTDTLSVDYEGYA